MHSEFEAYLLHRGKELSESKCWSAVIAKDEGRFVGWVLVRSSISQPYLMCYVKPSFRRKGIGSELIKRARRYLKNVKKSKEISVFPHDFKSSKFFNKIAADHKDIYLDVWYDRPPINLLSYMYDRPSIQT